MKNFGFEKPKPKIRKIKCSSQQFCPIEFLIERKTRKNLKPALVCKCKAVQADLDEATRSCCFWENWEFESREKNFLIAIWATLGLSRLRVKTWNNLHFFQTSNSLLTKTHNDSDLDERNAAGRSKITQAWKMRPIKNDISFWHFCSTRIQMQGTMWETFLKISYQQVDECRLTSWWKKTTQPFWINVSFNNQMSPLSNSSIFMWSYEDTDSNTKNDTFPEWLQVCTHSEVRVWISRFFKRSSVFGRFG